jgi:hypothetical protein
VHINESTAEVQPFSSLSPKEAFRLLQASSNGRGPGHSFAVAGLHVRLHSPDAQLAHLFYRAFSHLPAPSHSTKIDIDLEIVTGDSRLQLNQNTGSGFFSDHGGHRFHASPDGRFVCHEVLESGSLWCVDRTDSRAIGWIESPERLTLNESNKPLPNLLALLLQPFGLYMFHAALVSWRNYGVLFVGASGSGKSTSALACLLGGFDFLSEDFVILQETPTGFIGHSVYNSAWLDPDHLSRFGDLRRHARTGDGEQRKSVMMMAEIMPERMRSSVGLDLMILPVVAPDGPSAIHEAGRPEALRQLAPNCLMTASRLDKTGFESLVRLVKASRCYRLHLGNDLENVPSLVRDVVERNA